MPRKLATSVALAALAAASLAGASGASAAAKVPAKTTTKTVKIQPKRATALKPSTRVTVAIRADHVVAVKASSTGKGPATNAECQGYAADLDTAYEALADYMIEDMDDEAQGMSDAIDEIEAKGVKRGCAFTY